MTGASTPVPPERPATTWSWLDAVQAEVDQWTRRFRPTPESAADPMADALCIAEEAGEVCRAVLKRAHGKRPGTDWAAEVRLEAADVAIGLLSLAANEGWSLAEAINDRWEEVRTRGDAAAAPPSPLIDPAAPRPSVYDNGGSWATDATAAASPVDRTEAPMLDDGPVHLISDGQATTSCCRRSPFELPRRDRATADPALATCGAPTPSPVEPEGDEPPTDDVAGRLRAAMKWAETFGHIELLSVLTAALAAVQRLQDERDGTEQLIDALRTRLATERVDVVPVEDVAMLVPGALGREKVRGWVHFHPERFCHECGGRNLESWATTAESWALAFGGDGRILCPLCLDRATTEANGRYLTWNVEPRPAASGQGAEPATDDERSGR